MHPALVQVEGLEQDAGREGGETKVNDETRVVLLPALVFVRLPDRVAQQAAAAEVQVLEGCEAREGRCEIS